MRTAFAVSLLGALAVAAPQGINFDVVNNAAAPTLLGPPIAAVTQTNVYNPSSAAAAAAAAVTSGSAAGSSKRDIEKRQNPAPCGQEPDGYGPVAQPNTVQGFENYPPFAQFAYGTPAPAGYSAAFRNLNASTSQAGYMGLYTLKFYNATQCGQLCDSTSGCQAFNLYFERDPTLNPADACPNPPAFTNIKCTLWGSPVSAATATNAGQFRDQFQVVIAGSDGFNKGVPAPSFAGYTSPQALGGAIDAAAYAVGAQFFAQPYTPLVCASACKAITTSNHAAAQAAYSAGGASTYAPCNYFNAYELERNGVPAGFYCSYYSRSVASSAATLTSASYQGATYSVVGSYGYAASSPDSGSVA